MQAVPPSQQIFKERICLTVLHVLSSLALVSFSIISLLVVYFFFAFSIALRFFSLVSAHVLFQLISAYFYHFPLVFSSLQLLVVVVFVVVVILLSCNVMV